MAFRQGAQKRLDDLKADIASQEEELEGLKSTSAELEQKIVDDQAQGLDASATQAQLADIQKEIAEKEDALKADKDREPDLEENLGSYREYASDPETLKLYLNDVFYPVINGLQAYTALGSWMRFVGDNSLETTVYIKGE